MNFVICTRLMLLVPFVSGCEVLGINSLSENEKAVIGAYTLATMNGAGLPARAGELGSEGAPDGCPIFIDRGGFELNDDHSYDVEITIRSVCPDLGGGTVIDQLQQTGTWQLNGTNLDLTDRRGASLGYQGPVVLAEDAITASVQIEWVGHLPRAVIVFRR